MEKLGPNSRLNLLNGHFLHQETKNTKNVVGDETNKYAEIIEHRPNLKVIKNFICFLYVILIKLLDQIGLL